MDLPSSGPKDGVMMELRGRGYQAAGWKVRCTDYGDTMAKVKWIVVGLQDRSDVGEWKPPAVTAADPNGINKVVGSCTHRGAWLDDEWEVCLSRRISTSGEKMLPWPAGHCWPVGDKSKKRLIYDVRGPALTPRKDEVMAVYDPRAKEANKGVRWLSIDEEWLANGGQQEANAILRQAGGCDEDIKNEVLRRMPQRTAHCFMSWAEKGRQGGGSVCAANRVVTSWLSAWRRRPDAPRQEFEERMRRARQAREQEEPTHLVGGRPRKPRAKSAPPSADVIPLALGRSRERLVIDANRTLEKEKAWLDAMAAEAIMAKLSEGSKVGYEIGWRQWCLWRRVEGKDVYLVGEGRQDRKEDEDELLRYLTYLAKVMNRAEGTIRQRLFAIKMGHVVAGYEDPTLHRTRLWAALSGFKRWQPETKRKYPVLPVMMKWLRSHIDGSTEIQTKDKAALWAALCTAFFYLLRASEYLVQNNREWSLKRVLKGKDIEGHKENARCPNLSEAEEVVIYLYGSKTDQFNQGAVRNHYRSEDEKLCPVEALAGMQRAFPERFQGVESDEPLFRYESGMPITRDEVQRLLQLAAIADGQPASRYGSHSLRIGGATAIYMTSQDLEHVKRYGRWASSASCGNPKGMARADGQLLPPRQLRAREEQKVGHTGEGPGGHEFHTKEVEGYLKRGGYIDDGRHSEPDAARATEDPGQPGDLIYKSDESRMMSGEHLGEIVEGDYTKHQQHKQQHVYVNPHNVLGNEGQKTIAWTHFAIKKCLRLVPS